MNQKPNFAGRRVAAFESRRGDDMSRLITRSGGEPHVSASMQELPLDNNAEAVDFAHKLITGQIDLAIFLTGVGFDFLLRAIEKHVDRDRYLNGLTDIITVARGPKPVAAMKAAGIDPTHKVPPPNTWRELLTLLDASVPLANLTVAVQEYGKPNPSLTAGLEARGAHVVNVTAYRWDLPSDDAPLKANVEAIAAGERDVLLFTSAQQVVNVLHVAEQLGLADQLRKGFDKAAVCSIGPTTSDMLREHDLPVDMEPTHAKMGHLVTEAAERSEELLSRKQRVAAALSGPASDPLDKQAPWYDSQFMKACRLEPTDYTPVWLMRQAGRYMAEYREVRAKTTFLELCKNPALCSEVMCTAVDKLGVDAAIIFSDLLPILEPMGLDLEFAQGEGPVIHNPVREAPDVDRVAELETVESLDYVMETVRQTRNDLPADLPLIGFAGAPFTLASYTIEGGASRSYLFTKTLMYRDTAAWDALMSRLARAVSRYLTAQISAGAQVVQIFDSWVGCLGVEDYRTYVLPYVRQIVDAMPRGVPVIYFGTGNPALLPAMADANSSVVGVDWRIPLDEAWNMVGHDRAVQGNMEPAMLLADRDTIRQRAKLVLDQAGGRPGHIFNLGHGVHQQTPVENAIALVEAVHELSGK